MKKILAVILVLLSLAGVASADLYPAVGIVYDLDYENDTVVFEDFCGFLWKLEGIEDWDIGDVGAMLMDDLDTESIFDDVILEVRYAGYLPE